MRISRNLAIQILKYLNKNPDFHFPFFVMCQEYASEENNFAEIHPDDWVDVLNDENYKTFELWNKYVELNNYSINLLSKGFIEKMFKFSFEISIYNLFNEYNKFYKEEFFYSSDIERYWENEFFWWKKEAYEEVIELLHNKKYYF